MKNSALQPDEKLPTKEPFVEHASNMLRAANSDAFDVLSVPIPGRNPGELALQDEIISRCLFKVFRDRLSPAETNLLGSPALDRSQNDALVWVKFDEMLIELAPSWGWRLLESSVVRTRIALWTDHGDPADRNEVKKLRRFTEALNLYAQFKRGLAKLPLAAPELYGMRKNTLAEMKVLQNKLMARFAMARSRATREDVHSAIRSEIQAAPNAYHHLSGQLTSLLNFFSTEDGFGLAVNLIAKQTTPATLVDAWFDYQSGSADGKSRQAISRIGSKRRKS